MPATVALEMIGPTPGTVISRTAPSSACTSSAISLDTASIRSSSRRQSPASSSTRCTMRGVSLLVMVTARGSSARNARKPWRIAMPRSSRKARIWLMTPVRCDINRSRTRCSACRSSYAGVF